MEHIISRALELVILDCDGVLFDSFRSNVVYYNTMLERMGEPPMNIEAERLSHVLSTPQLLAHLFQESSDKFHQAYLKIPEHPFYKEDQHHGEDKEFEHRTVFLEEYLVDDVLDEVGQR